MQGDAFRQVYACGGNEDTEEGQAVDCYLLESASQIEVWGRYSFLGYDPRMEITCLDDVVTVRETMPERRREKGNSDSEPSGRRAEKESLQTTGLLPWRICRDSQVVLWGYVSDDYSYHSEPKLKPLMSSRPDEDENQEFRDMDLMLFDKVIAFDHYRQKLLLIAGVSTQPRKVI